VNITLEKCDYHRNGIGGNGFHVALFTYKDDGRARKMLAVLFDDPNSVAVFDRELLAQGIIGMFEGSGNAFRGADYFGPHLRPLIESEMNAKTRQWEERR
jgi:hypothetical protein